MDEVIELIKGLGDSIVLTALVICMVFATAQVVVTWIMFRGLPPLQRTVRWQLSALFTTFLFSTPICAVAEAKAVAELQTENAQANVELSFVSGSSVLWTAIVLVFLLLTNILLHKNERHGREFELDKNRILLEAWELLKDTPAGRDLKNWLLP